MICLSLTSFSYDSHSLASLVPRYCTTLLLCLSCISITHSLILVALEGLVCHTVTISHIALVANIHCNETWLWFKASGFCYSINPGLSPNSTPTFSHPESWRSSVYGSTRHAP